MNRKSFIGSLTGVLTGSMLGDFHEFAGNGKQPERKMPVFFIGHGSPMNGIENNDFSNKWKKLASHIPLPTAILCISAHWLTRGSFVTSQLRPNTIHDFGGFPKELYEVEYPAPGNPDLAADIVGRPENGAIGLNTEWGLDHGTWTILRHIYPAANIPVVQLSIDYSKPLIYHYELAKELAWLRNKGVLIIGSGNMVHNLQKVAWDRLNEKGYGYDWAIEINTQFKELILNGNHKALLEPEKLGRAAEWAIPTPDHYIPLLYALALQGKEEAVAFFNDTCVAGSLSMTSLKIG